MIRKLLVCLSAAVILACTAVLPAAASSTESAADENEYSIISRTPDSITIRKIFVIDHMLSYSDFDNSIEYDGEQYSYSKSEQELLDTINDVGNEKRTQEVTTSELPKQEYDFDKTITATYNGKDYTAKFVSSYFTAVDNGSGNNYITTHAQGTTTYPKQTSEPSVPQQKEFPVKNDITGETENRVLNLDRVEATEKTWGDEETLDFEFQNYSADKYDINGEIFYHDDENCPLNNNLDVLYEMLGWNNDDYKMIRAEWNGKENKKNDTRKALIYYQRRTSTYVAYYSGDVTFVGNEENPTTYIGHGIYEYEVKKSSNVRYKYAANITYDLVQDSSEEAVTQTDSSIADSAPDTSSEAAVTELTSINDTVSKVRWTAAKTVAVVGGGGVTLFVCGVSVFFYLSSYVVAFDSNEQRICSCKIGDKGKINVLGAALKTGDKELIIKARGSMGVKKLQKYGGPTFCLNKLNTLDYDVIDDIKKVYKVYLRKRKEDNK